MKKSKNVLNLITLTMLLFLFITSCKKNEDILQKNETVIQKNQTSIQKDLTKMLAGHTDRARLNKSIQLNKINLASSYSVRYEFNRILLNHANEGYTYDDIAMLGNEIFLREIGADDLTMIEIIRECKSVFDIDITDDDSEKLQTIGDFIEYLTKNSPYYGSSPTPEDLFAERIDRITQVNDSWYFTTTSSSLNFSSVSEFKSYLDNLTFENSITSGPGDNKVIIFKVTRVAMTGEKIFVSLVKNSSNVYEFESVASEAWGFSLASSWAQLPNPQHTVNGDVITIDVYGFVNYNVVIESFGTFYKQYVHYRMKINRLTAAPISIERFHQ